MFPVAAFLRKKWPIQLAFLIFIVCRIFLSSITVCNTYTLLIQKIAKLLDSMLNEDKGKFVTYFWISPRSGRIVNDFHLSQTGFEILNKRLIQIVTWKKGKAIPLQSWTGPEGSRRLRLPDSRQLAHEGGKVVSRTHRPPLSPGNIPGTHFC